MKKFVFTFLLFISSAFMLNAQVTGLSGWNIFIDPGHSQTENMGIYNYAEASKVLRVGLALRDYLLNETDIDTVYMSRTNDQQVVSLTQRTDLANSLGAAWFHSIHSDASSDPTTNSTLLLHGGWRHNGVTVEKTPHGGKAMSDIMIDILTRGYRIPTRGNYADRTFYQGFPDNHDNQYPYLHVNRESSMPSELSEAGFHTSIVQNQKNMNADWKKLEARTMYWTILKYHNIPRPSVRILNGVISDIESGIPINSAIAFVDTQSYSTDSYQSLFHLYSTDSTQLHNGFYYFENLPGDSLKLIVTAPNYLPDTSMVAISDTFFTFKDVKLISTLPPSVVSTNLLENDSLYPGKEDLIFNFSRRMNIDSVQSNLKITPSAYLVYSWTSAGRTLRIKTDSLNFSTNYKINILPNALDLYGNLFDGNSDGVGGDAFEFIFKTEQIDQDAPKVVNFYPDENQNVELRPIIRVNFDETINLSGLSSLIKLIKVSDQSQVNGSVRHYVINNKSVLHFFPSADLNPSEEYQFIILSGIKDGFGNTTSSDSNINFKTGNTIFEVTSIDNFDANLTTNWWQPTTSGSTVGVVPGNTTVVENATVTNLITGSSKSMLLNYSWDPGSTVWLIREYLNAGAPRNVLFDKNFLMQVYVFGDGSKNQFRFAVDDNVPPGTTHEVSPWFNIDWSGWKLVAWDMANDSVGNWIGDGALDGQLRFDSFQLTYNQTNGVQSGTILFDDLRLAKKIIVGVENSENSASLPTSFELSQNYPNPFNPATKIRYAIPAVGGKNALSVQLIIYDILGNEVAVLVNREQRPGNYEVEFNGSHPANGTSLTSGVYFYTLKAGEFTQTKKLILLK